MTHKITDIYDVFMLDVRARGLSDHTVAFYRTQLSSFIDWCVGRDVSLWASVTPSLIRLYLVERQSDNVSSHTVHAAARALRAFCNFAVREGLSEVSPMRNVVMPRTAKKILPAFTNEDIRKLIAACTNERDEAIVLFLLDTGIRSSELLALRGEDVSLKTGVVTVRGGKGNKDRMIYMGNKTAKALRRYYMERGTPEKHEHIWLLLEGAKPLTYSGLRQMLERIGRRAGVDHCHPHTFRRTFALWCLRAGMNIYLLARLMGHTDISVLKSYLAIVEDDAQEAHSRSSPVDNM